MWKYLFIISFEKIEINWNTFIHYKTNFKYTPIKLPQRLRESVKQPTSPIDRKTLLELYNKFREIYARPLENNLELYNWLRDDVASALLGPSVEPEFNDIRNIINTIVGKSSISTDELSTALDRIYLPYIKHVKSNTLNHIR